MKRDLTGRRFGRLVAVERAESGPNWSLRWTCACDCGATKVVTQGSLVAGDARSCGCLRREATAQRNRQRSRIDRRDISVSAQTIARVRAASRRTGLSMREIVTAAVAEVTP